MRLISFDGLALSQAGAEIGNPLEFRMALVELPGMAGAFDAYGDEQQRAPLALDYKGKIVGATPAAADTAIDALRAKANKGLRWLVVEIRGGTQRGCWAKLTKIGDTAKPEDVLSQDISLSFEVPWPWFELVADVWYLDAGEALDDDLTLDPHYTSQSGAGTFTINNTGGDRITRGLLVVKGASTEPRIENTTTGEWVQYGGSLASGETLVIDVGAQTALLGGLNVWSDITIGDMQTRIFSLATGANSITFSGGGTLEVHWARVY
jgi:hypothetical protein